MLPPPPYFLPCYSAPFSLLPCGYFYENMQYKNVLALRATLTFKQDSYMACYFGKKKNHFPKTALWESEAKKNLLFSLPLAQPEICLPCCGLRYLKLIVTFFFSFALNGITALACCQVWLKLNLDTQRTYFLGTCVKVGRLMSCYGDQF